MQAFFTGLRLNTPTATAGRGDAHGAAVGQIYLLLHQPFAKRTTAYDDAAVIVLYGSGHNDRYATEIYERYLAGEAFSADSVKFDDSMLFSTTTGRSVYGGGGIMPDIFVPSDTTNYTQYLTSVVNAGLAVSRSWQRG